MKTTAFCKTKTTTADKAKNSLHRIQVFLNAMRYDKASEEIIELQKHINDCIQLEIDSHNT